MASNNQDLTLAEAFATYERSVRIENYKVGCVLAFIFMPAGASLDYFVYPAELVYFLKLRLLCSLLLATIWLLLRFHPGTMFYRVLGLCVALLPLTFISWMIYLTEGAQSPYYAGLNLVMLGAAILLRWTLTDSVVVFGLAVASYLAACLLNGPILEPGTFFNNLYFLVVTGVFIVTGSWFYNQIRFREFELRYELDRSQHALQANHQKLVELDRAKDDFFANISHELRTPLTLLLAPLEALIHRPGPKPDPEAAEWYQTMYANGLRLLKLINDLLDLVKVEARKLEIKREPVDIVQFVHGLASAVRKLAEDRGLTVHSTVDAELGSVLVDHDKLEKVCLNLLHNAVKFTPAGGRIDFLAEQQAGQLVLRVKDTGIGIPPEHLTLIFNRFWQADTSAHRKHQGTGIGLALVKELVEACGGSVQAESQPEVGTTMIVRLPYLPASASADAAQPAATVPQAQAAPASDSLADPASKVWVADLGRRAGFFPSVRPLRDSLRPPEIQAADGRPRVLIADDEPDMLRFLRSQLSAQFQVLEAVDGQQAIDKASQFLPEVVLCDLMMPEKDGLQVCRELRAHAPTRTIPIVLLTARADEETKLRSLSAGASDFLTKPFSATELHVRLKNLVEAYALQKQLAWQNQKLQATLDQLKETELQLVQSEKLASLGRLSAGIIHEINNPLNFVKTCLYTLRRQGELLPTAELAAFSEVVKDMEEGVTRVSRIVSDLRNFSRPDRGHMEPVEIEVVVEAALRFLAHEVKDQVIIEWQPKPGQRVQGNQNLLIQVLVNLIQNSLDALKQKGLSNERATIWLTFDDRPPRPRLVVRDNGPGIPPEHQGKVFEPFFTTKQVGQGMGLGLSISYRIMQELAGTITMRSEPGRFCEFTLEFAPSPC